MLILEQWLLRPKKMCNSILNMTASTMKNNASPAKGLGGDSVFGLWVIELNSVPCVLTTAPCPHSREVASEMLW